MGYISTAAPWDPIGEATPRKTSLNNSPDNDGQQWYALQTRLHREKKVESLLRARGTETFLPLISHIRRWSDRSKTITVPLFPGYLFTRLRPARASWLPMLATSGALAFAGSSERPSPIPDNQIEALRRLLPTEAICTVHPFLHDGQRVRIRGGALDGLQGILHDHQGKHLVVSIDSIDRCVCLRIEGYDLEIP